ncbi:MAG: hypothetical protein K6E29_05940 [Cyanobacteria bacterium RUI128]|nr:hypothetical protein [Cyanobacteria bacterium RUI128]
MKRFILALIATMLLTVPGFAWDVKTEAQLQERMNAVGFNLLNSSRIEHRMIFMVTNRTYSRDRWADVSSVNRTVWLKPCILPYIDSDDELAGILAHQISHGVDTYNGIFRGYISILNYWVAPNKYDLLADKRAVDYMVNAGYNPLAYIVILNKTMQQYRYDIFSNHTLVTRRMMKIYEYIYTKYPSILADNEYKDNVYYQNFLLTSRNNRMLLKEKLNKNSKKKINYKY